MKIFAVFVQPVDSSGMRVQRYIDSQWGVQDKAGSRAADLAVTFKAFSAEHRAWVVEMELADVEIAPAREKQ